MRMARYDRLMRHQSTAMARLVRWCAMSNRSDVLREGVLDRIGALIPFDGAFFATVDPATLLYTSAVRRGMPPGASRAFVRTEFGEDDVNQLRTLVRAATPVGWLDGATSGDRGSSLRYRDAMQPFGLGDELRVALEVDDWCWGLLCLHRADAASGFERREAALLGALGPHLAHGLRRAVVIDHAVEDWTPAGPAVLLVGPDGTVRATTPAASGWLDDLAGLDHPRTGELPTAVRAAVARTRHPSGPAGESLVPRARIQTPSGRWVMIQAAHLDGDEDSVAVVLEPATGVMLAPLVVAAYGFTAREAEVARRVLAGHARKAIATDLRISLHTVNDHLKAIFEKAAVSSAGQLRSRVFAEHYTDVVQAAARAAGSQAVAAQRSSVASRAERQ